MNATTIDQIMDLMNGKTPDNVELLKIQQRLATIAAQRDQLMSSLERQALTIAGQEKTIAELGIGLENANARIKYLAAELGKALEASKQRKCIYPRGYEITPVF